MKIENTFQIPADRERAWRLLQDIPAVARCVPGAHLTGVEGDTCAGRAKVKIGPIVMVYDGELEFVERNADAGVIAIRAAGKDKRGTGTVSATMRLLLERTAPELTTCTVDVDLDITGKPAQFGRSAVQDLASRLIRQFADNLAALVDAGEETGTAGGPATRQTTPPADEAFDLLGGSRVTVPMLAGALAAAILFPTLFIVVRRLAQRRARQ